MDERRAIKPCFARPARPGGSGARRRAHRGARRVGNSDDIVRTSGWDVGASPPMALGVEATRGRA